MKNLALVLLILFIGCKEMQNTSQKQVVQTSTFEYAVYEDKPVYEDEYLYPKERKNASVLKNQVFNMYQIDWNANGVFSEKGIDYVGVKSVLEDKPQIELLDSVHFVNYNGASYQVLASEGSLQIKKLQEVKKASMNILDAFVPFELEDGRTFEPDFSADTTVIYFWATWCRPCVKTLRNIAPKIEMLKEKGIDFIPVAYNCSNSNAFLEKNQLPFEDYVITEEAARVYNIKNLSKQYTFLQDKKVADKNLNLRKYYPSPKPSGIRLKELNTKE